MNKERGITLIALIVTIILLLILATVSINLIWNDNGILDRAKTGAEEYKKASIEEKVKLILGDYMIESAIGTKTIEEYLNEQKEKNELEEVTNNGDGTITVEVNGYEITIKEDDLSIVSIEKAEKLVMEQIEETESFSRANGVIDIVWLDMNNNVIPNPISPANYLGGLTAIKYNGTTEVTVSNPENDTSWYNYVAQTGAVDGKTSNWANAKSSNSNAYFVWIPRYAYKITYFDTPENANIYRTNNNSKTGIIGYSNIKGIIDVKSGTEKLVIGTEPTNVTGRVKTKLYSDYIPHPAFEFDGAKAGIWVGKFESSGSKDEVTIIPNTASLKYTSVSDIFTACQGIKSTYNLTQNMDSHMMKNIEWGACSYLAESKYGRNGIEVTTNDNTSYLTGGGNYSSNVLQSTTGNIYGIYDMNGGSWDYVAGYVTNSTLSSNGQNANLLNAVATNKKYADVYNVGTVDSSANNYSSNKGIKGDAVLETSTAGTDVTSWHVDYSCMPSAEFPVFLRGRYMR